VRVPQLALSAASAWASGAGHGPALKVADVLLPDEPPEELPPHAVHPSAKANASKATLHLNPLKAFIPPNFCLKGAIFVIKASSE